MKSKYMVMLILSVLLVCCLGGCAVDSSKIVIKPCEYQGAMRNPLKGFRSDMESGNTFERRFVTLARTYIKWNDIENCEADGIDKIKDYCNKVWKDVQKHNVKIIPRVYLDWDKAKGNEYWPADMTAGDFTSSQFKNRVRRLIERLGRCWDNDPRVAWVQLGIVGYWGECEQPYPADEVAIILGDAYTKAFRNKPVLVRHYPTFTDYEFGMYWDSWAHPEDMKSRDEIVKWHRDTGRWKLRPVEGEAAYNWGQYKIQPGDSPDDTLIDPHHREHLINTIRSLHCSGLGWVAEYNQNDPEACAGAQEVQKAFGYRFVLDEVSYSPRINPGESFAVSLKVRNTGSAPFYRNWPLEVSLLNPGTKEVVWKETFAGVDIRSWLCGQQWNIGKQAYNMAAPTYNVSSTFSLPADIDNGNYILSLAILDPAGMLPSVRFAITNYFIGGRHPIGLIGVAHEISDSVLDPQVFDDPAQDRTLHYCNTQ